MKYLITALSLICYYSIHAQPGPFDNPLEAFCNPICDSDDLNGYSFTMNDAPATNPGSIPGCGGVINNPSWLSFVGSGGTINLTITPSNCVDVANGNTPNLDIQAAIYQVSGSDCSNPDITEPSADNNILCDDDCDFTPNTIFFDFNSVRGQQYLILLDGCSGDYCDVDFSFSGPGTDPLNLTEIEDINGVENGGTIQVCSGTTDFELTVNGDSAYQNYIWNTANGDFNTDEATIFQDFPVDGDFLYCVQAATACDATDQFCVTVVVGNTITPTFDQIGPFCLLDDLQTLPTSSTNDIPINGSWSGPGVTQGNLFDPSGGPQDLTFTPDSEQCANPITLTINTDDPDTPTFDPMTPLCFDDSSQPLPTTSTNGFSGTWSGDGVNNNSIEPVPGLDNLNITFTPDDGLCVTQIQVQIPIIEIEVNVMNIHCNDAGSSNDPSDDWFTFDVLVSGNDNLSNSWFANDNNNTQGDYIIPSMFGPFLISDGIVQFEVTDNQNPFCFASVIVDPPSTCSSSSCNINPLSIFNLICNDQNTPADSTDDTYTFQLQVTGNLTSTNGWVADDLNNSSGQYNEAYTFGPYLISNGTFTMTITDADDSNCQQSVLVLPPPTCSNSCSIQGQVSNIICDDNGTNEVIDDIFYFDILMTGMNTSNNGWTVIDDPLATGDYNVNTTLGPYLITNGVLNLIVSDNGANACISQIQVTPPLACSMADSTCQVSEVTIINVLCNNENTPYDPSDDTYQIDLLVNGINVSDIWSANDSENTSGSYEESTIIGPFQISDGPFNLLISDSEDLSCNFEIQITPPTPCSIPDTTCQIFELLAMGAICQDQNTPNDPSDDTYTVDILVNGNNVSSGWTANDPLNTSGVYGVYTTFGPYDARDTLNILVMDNDDPSCNFDFTIQAPDNCGFVSIVDLASNGIEVYPNPFKDQIILKSETGLIYQSELINTLGQVVKRYPNNVIETDDVLPGVYYLRVWSNGKVMGTSALVKL